MRARDELPNHIDVLDLSNIHQDQLNSLSEQQLEEILNNRLDGLSFSERLENFKQRVQENKDSIA